MYEYFFALIYFNMEVGEKRGWFLIPVRCCSNRWNTGTHVCLKRTSVHQTWSTAADSVFYCCRFTYVLTSAVQLRLVLLYVFITFICFFVAYIKTFHSWVDGLRVASCIACLRIAHGYARFWPQGFAVMTRMSWVGTFSINLGPSQQ